MDLAKLTSKLTGDMSEKRRWWHYKKRVKQLPSNYRTAVEAFEHYLMYLGTGGGVPMFEDLIDLFEQSAADRTPLREVVGADPVEFIETFAQNYKVRSWIDRHRERLVEAIARAESESTER